MQESRRAPVKSAASNKNHRAGTAFVATAACTVAADQLSKLWAVNALTGGKRVELVGDLFQFRLVTNPGSAFGLFAGGTFVLFLVNLVVLTVVCVLALRNGREPLKFGLIVGGGAGNLVDRLIRPPGIGQGEVIDFIYLSFWPTFNIADIAIVVGVTLLLAGSHWRQQS